MTRPSPVRFLSGIALLVVLLSSCAGNGSPVDSTADAAAASANGQSASESPAGTPGSGGSGDATDGGGQGSPGDQGNPGGPGADPADGGGNDAGAAVAEGNPGAPGDVSVFEERGVSYADFRDGSAQRVCVDEGKCTLAPVRDPVGTYSDPEQCPIADMSYSGGTHTDAEGQEQFLEGATVTVTVDCTSLIDPDGNGVPGDQSSDGTTTDGSTTDSPATDSPTTDSPTTDGSTTDDSTTDTGDQPQG